MLLFMKVEIVSTHWNISTHEVVSVFLSDEYRKISCRQPRDFNFWYLTVYYVFRLSDPARGKDKIRHCYIFKFVALHHCSPFLGLFYLMSDKRQIYISLEAGETTNISAIKGRFLTFNCTFLHSTKNWLITISFKKWGSKDWLIFWPWKLLTTVLLGASHIRLAEMGAEAGSDIDSEVDSLESRERTFAFFNI